MPPASGALPSDRLPGRVARRRGVRQRCVFGTAECAALRAVQARTLGAFHVRGIRQQFRELRPLRFPQLQNRRVSAVRGARIVSCACIWDRRASDAMSLRATTVSVLATSRTPLRRRRATKVAHGRKRPPPLWGSSRRCGRSSRKSCAPSSTCSANTFTCSATADGIYRIARLRRVCDTRTSFSE